MGYHYVPQYYLNGFTSSSGCIWMHDKDRYQAIATQPKNVANESHFYSDPVETYLANEIEAPGNSVLAKIRRRQHITPAEKADLTRYIVALIKRVPQGKNRIKEIAPQVAKSLAEKYDQQIDSLINADAGQATVLVERKNKILKILSSYQQGSSEEVWELNIPPATTPMIVEAIRTMTWCFWEYYDAPAFITCDNPVFFFESMGIGKLQSEITFPISSHIVLWATWRRDLPESGFLPARSAVVKEFNRRTLTNSTRFIFAARKEEWIFSVLRKGRIRLNRIV